MSHPTTDQDIYEFFKTADLYNTYKASYPEYRSTLPVPHFDPRKIVDDIGLHRKLHYSEWTGDVALSPLIDILEDLMEGHALLQVEAAWDDQGLPHIAN